MKVFISWSGNRSRAVAELLNDWIKCVLQATRPWLSTGIDRGSLWFTEIHDQLKDASVGIVCLTQENKNRPWILFEAGSLAKGLSSNRVCTFLIDLEPKDLEDPLAQFNHTLFKRESVWELVRTLNKGLGDQSLDERILPQVFETYWPRFEAGFALVIKENPPAEKVEPRPKEDILAEILSSTRSLNHRLAMLETRSSSLPNEVVFSSKGLPREPVLDYSDFLEHLKYVSRMMAKTGAHSDEIMKYLQDAGFPEAAAADLAIAAIKDVARSDLLATEAEKRASRKKG